MKQIRHPAKPQCCPSAGTLLAVTVPCTPGLQNSPSHLQTPSYFIQFQSILKRGFRDLLLKPNLRPLPHPYRSDVIYLHLDVGFFSLYVISTFALAGLMAEGGHWLRYPPLAMGPTPPAPLSR